jgi:tight adherence protein C
MLLVLLPWSWALLIVGAVTFRPTAVRRPPSTDPRRTPSSRRPRGPRTTIAASWRHRRRRAHELADAVPDVIDLFAVAVAAGCNTRLAVAAIAERAPPGPLADALADVCQRVRAGDRLADALDTMRDELDSDAVRPLVGALTDAERYGSALGPTLDRLADDARRARQRRAEEAARKLPVKLLFPLVVCILPAFGLLTVAPLIAGGLRALRL